MDIELFLSQPSHRQAVKTIVRRALIETEPLEAELVESFIDPLIDEAAKGEITQIDTANSGGGFGGADLMVVVIVPVVIQAISKLLDQLGWDGFQQLRKRLTDGDPDARVLVEVSEVEVKVIVRHTRSPGARRRVKELTRIINEVLADYLENDWDPDAADAAPGIVYQDFAIFLAKVGDGHRAEVLPSAGGSAPADFEPPWDEEELADLLSSLEGLMGGKARDLRREKSPEPPADPKDVGTALFSALFADGIRDAYRQRLGAVRDRQEGLRVRLVLDPEEKRICALPWELLYDPVQRQFLAHNPKTPVVRYLRRKRPMEPRLEAADLPLRILVIDAVPQDAAGLDVGRELSGIEDALEARDDIRMIPLRMATSEGLRCAIRRDDPHVLHFMGHGKLDEDSGHGSILLAGPGGEMDPLTGEALSVVLSGCDALRLVVLNACQTASLPRREGLDVFSGMAPALIGSGLPAVVAMQFPITDNAAIAFGRSLYDALASGDPIEAALAEGRQAIFNLDRKRGSCEWATPVLYLSVEEGQIFQFGFRARRASRP